MSARIKLIALEMLRGGRAVLSIPGAWTQGVYARNSCDFAVGVEDDAACKFCAAGVMLSIARRAGSHKSHAISGAFSLAFGALCDETGGQIIGTNDTASSVTPILAAYDRAIAKLEAEVKP